MGDSDKIVVDVFNKAIEEAEKNGDNEIAGHPIQELKTEVLSRK